MLSVGPGARHFSPSQNIRVTEPAKLVMYITDSPPQRAHNQHWQEADTGSSPPPTPVASGFSALFGVVGAVNGGHRIAGNHRAR